MKKISFLWKKRKSVVVTWLISYSIVLFIPIVLSIIIYLQSNATLESEIRRSNDLLLKQMRYTIDNEVELMKRLNLMISWNQKLQKLLFFSNEQKNLPFQYYEIAQAFNEYQSSFTTVDEFYVYWIPDESFIRAGNVRDLSTAYHTIHNTGDYSFEQWTNYLKNFEENNFVVWNRLYEGKVIKTIAYVTQLSKRLDGNKNGLAVVMMDISRFESAIQNISGLSEGHLLILNHENEILISNRSIDSDNKMDYPFIVNNKINLNSFHSNDSQLFYISSEVSNLKYAVILPNGVYWEKTEYVRKIVIVAIIVSLISATMLTWFFTKRHYSPIQKLVMSLTGGNSIFEEKEWNEIHYIQQAILNTRTEKNEILMQLDKHQQVLRSNLLYRLLKGKTDKIVSYEEAFESFNMNIKSNEFAVILFILENNSDLYAKLPGIDMNEREKLVQFIFSNVIEELAQKYNHYGYVTEIEDAYACLINLDCEQESRHMHLKNIAKEAQCFLEKYDMELTVSISNIHQGWNSVSICYQESVDALEYKLILGKREIITFNEISSLNTNDTNFYYPLHVEQQLINIMKSGQHDKAKEYLNEILNYNLQQPIYSLALAKALTYNIALTMFKTMIDLKVDHTEKDTILNSMWMETMMNFETISEKQAYLYKLMSYVCEIAKQRRDINLQNDRDQNTQLLIEKVTEYIELNYMDSSLNVNKIGDYFNLKGSYLSKMYKTYTSVGLLDYLHKFRIDRAKQLMKEGKETVLDISKNVGYNDVATFIRVFKKFEGVTPGKYKEIL